MPNGLDEERVGLVFQSRPDILAGIRRAAGKGVDPASLAVLFNEIAKFVQEQTSGGEPASKRRKVDNGVTNGHTTGTPASGSAAGSSVGSIADAASEQVLLEIKEISLSIPVRKKFDLCFTKSYLYARAPGTIAPVQGIIYAWRDIEYAFYLPVPEKAQLQHNYVLLPRNTALASISKTGPAPDTEPLVFTVPATPPKPGTVGGPSAGAAAAVSDTYGSLLHWALTTQLRSAGNGAVAIVSSDAKLFHSVVRQPHRPADKATHVKAFRGSKDGYLFFLPTGILWAFKKPLLFIPLERVTAVSYTSVLQRTFNMVVEVDAGGDASEEVEFAMLDQEDYGGIDQTYVRRHGLLDGSMAARRKAKTELAENLKKGKAGTAGDDAAGAPGDAAANGEEPDDGLTELQRAEMMLQDEEDEMEEDYDPGSGGESDSEGGTSDDDDEEDGEDYGEGNEGEDGEDDGDDNEEDGDEGE